MGDLGTPARGGARALLPAYITVFVDFLGYSATVVILPYISMEQNATAFQVMCATSGVFYAGQMIGSIIMGYASDRVGRRPVVLLSLLGCSLSYVWCIFITDVHTLMLARLMGGITGGTLPVVQAMVLDLVEVETERAECLSRVNASFGMAFAVGPALGAVVNEFFGKRAVFAVVAILGCLCSIFAATFLEETLNIHPVKNQRGGDSALNRSNLRGMTTMRNLPSVVWIGVIAIFGTAYAFSTLTSALPLFYVPLFGWGASELGTVATLFGLSMALYNVFLTKHIISSVGPEGSSMLASFLTAVAVILSPMIPSVLGHVAGMLIPFALGWALQLPSLSQLAARSLPLDQRGSAMGVLVGSLSLGRAVSPFITGYLYKSDWLVAPYGPEDVNDITLREATVPFSFAPFVVASGGCIIGLAAVALFRSRFSDISESSSKTIQPHESVKDFGYQKMEEFEK